MGFRWNIAASCLGDGLFHQLGRAGDFLTEPLSLIYLSLLSRLLLTADAPVQRAEGGGW